MTDYFEIPERKAYYKFRQQFSNINDENFTVEKILDEELDLDSVSLKDMIKNCESIILKHPEYTNIVLECTRGYEGDPDSFYLLGHRKMTSQEKEEYTKILTDYNTLEKTEKIKHKREEFEKLKKELNEGD